MKNRNEKQFVLSILLVVVILGIGTTIALSTAISKPVVNSFQAADHETNIKEEIDGLKKTIQVKNTADKSAAFVRVRIVISPAKALGQDDYMIQGQIGLKMRSRMDSIIILRHFCQVKKQRI